MYIGPLLDAGQGGSSGGTAYGPAANSAGDRSQGASGRSAAGGRGSAGGGDCQGRIPGELTMTAGGLVAGEACGAGGVLE